MTKCFFFNMCIHRRVVQPTVERAVKKCERRGASKVREGGGATVHLVDVWVSHVLDVAVPLCFLVSTSSSPPPSSRSYRDRVNMERKSSVCCLCPSLASSACHRTRLLAGGAFSLSLSPFVAPTQRGRHSRPPQTAIHEDARLSLFHVSHGLATAFTRKTVRACQRALNHHHRTHEEERQRPGQIPKKNEGGRRINIRRRHGSGKSYVRRPSASFTEGARVRVSACVEYLL